MRASLSRLTTILLLTCASWIRGAPTTRPIWDLPALSRVPQTQPAPGFQAAGANAIFYEVLPWQGKPTRAFAWYGIPATKEGQKVPAMVLIHGGGGTAFAEWVQLWVGRGYAAIAMDTCGCVPRGKYGAWQRNEMGGPAGWGGFEQIDQPVADQWTYHAVADVILAHSLLRSLPQVDADRIGVTGISWGGYLTCIVAGVDSRFKLAVPVYGCGFLGENSTWLGQFASMGKEKAGKWLDLWDPSAHLPGAKMPMLWVTGTNDFAYPMDSLRKSYRLPPGERTLCLRIRMPHGHGGAGENPEEIHAFADSILRDGQGMARITGRGREGGRAWITFKSPRPIARAELILTLDTGKWQARKWDSSPAPLDAAASRVSAVLPDGVKVYYFNLIDEQGLVLSSEHEEMAATPERQ